MSHMKRKGRRVAKRRAHTTHGYGSMKKHRHAGSRGGRGRAGTGKRADQKKSSLDPSTYFGKYGFHSRKWEPRTINVQDLMTHVTVWTKKKCLEKKGAVYHVDLKLAGIDKILGAGIVTKAFVIRVLSASPRAIEKIKAAGGSVEILGAQKKKTARSKKSESSDEKEEGADTEEE